MKTNPIILDNSETFRLEKLMLNEKHFDENWIQDLIYKNPQLLPSTEIEPVFGNQISIGREITTNAGYIDNLFINSDGYLTIVETKLWRNPEARREVVAQIIDYAKELNKWNFQLLNESVINSNRNYNNSNDGIIELIKKYDNQIDEKEFIDNIERNLKKGRFLLLIVGDGIRENVQDMVEYLSQMPQLYFTLALVELQIFKTKINNKELSLIIPNIITRTKEITRAIVKIEGVNPEQIKVEIPETQFQDKSKTVLSKRFTISEQDFFDILAEKVNSSEIEFARKILQDCQTKGLFIDWKQGSFVVKYFNPELSSLKYTLFVVTTGGQIYPGWVSGQLEKANIDKSFSIKFVTETAELFDIITIVKESSWSRYAKISELQKVYSNFMQLVDSLVNFIETELIKINNNN